MKNIKLPILQTLIVFLILTMVLAAAPIKPVARFEFEKSEYQQNEPIEVIDSSFCDDGRRISTQEWMLIVDKKRKKSTNLMMLLKNAKPGQYEVFLRVRAQGGGLWSDWTSRKLTIKSGQPITVMSFKTEKSTYAIGEKLSFVFPYNNPNELKVKSQKWTYKNLTTGVKVAGKPRYFSKTGKYEVTMQVQDEWGNWSKPMTCIVSVGTETIERNGYYLFLKGKQGDLLEGYIDKDYNTLETISNVEIEDKPGKLLISDSPERVKSSGILYKDSVSGEGRLLVHHQNAAGAGKKLVVVAVSNESTDVNLSISNKAIEGPNRDILGTGQNALNKYLKGTPQKNYTLKPNQPVCIYDSTLSRNWKKEDLVSGLFDFNSSGNVTLTVAALDSSSPIESISKLSPLSGDRHIRGTFDVTERYYTVDTTDIEEPTKLVVGKESEEWLTGIDAMTGEQVQNMGNYGVSIYIKIKNNENMGVILNARGGAYQGAIKWRDGRVFNSPTEEVLTSKKIATLVGMIKANEPNQFTYMLPNGSAAPVLFGFIPEKFWK